MIGGITSPMANLIRQQECQQECQQGSQQESQQEGQQEQQGSS